MIAWLTHAAKKGEKPLWEKLYALEESFRRWYVQHVLKLPKAPKDLRYNVKLVNVVRDRTNWVITLEFVEVTLLDPEARKVAEEMGLKVIYDEQHRVYHVRAEVKVSGRVLLKELEGRVGEGRLRRYVMAFCNLKWRYKKKAPNLVPPSVPEGWRRGVLCQTAEGLFIYFPYVDRYEEFEKLEDEFWARKAENATETWQYPYRIVFSSPLHQLIEVYTGETFYPKRQVITLPGLSASLSLETILALFKDPPYQLISQQLARLGLDLYPSELLTDRAKAELALALAEEVIKNQNRSVLPALYVKGLAMIALEWMDRRNELEEKVEQQRAEARAALKDPKSCPPLSHFRRDLSLLPHQAAALASLDKQPNAILGVDMGGGKTLLSLYDALVNVSRGRAKRSCIVMPNNLLYQFKDEVARFTAGSVNAVVVNSFTVRKYGLDTLKKMIQEAPPNTIVLCAYDWLALGDRTLASVNTLVDVHDRAAWLIGECGVDMVTLDEAHFIKNETSRRSESALLLAHARVKRVMSGTITPNKLNDLVVPTSFVKPHVFHGVDEFLRNYTVVGSRGGVRGYKPNAPEEIRQKLMDEGAIFFSRAAWIYLLPRREIKVHRVVMPEHLRVEYNRILNDTFDELEEMARKNPEVKAALEGIEDLSRYPYILQKLTALDRFLTAPETVSELVEALPEEKRVSPKVEKVKELLREHFADPNAGKVIIMCRYKESAKTVLKYLKMGEAAIYYDGSHKENLIKFKNNPKIKVMVAVDASLKHGWNITEATRIIRLELNYTWGDEDQSFGRIFRIGQEQDVRYDILLTDESFEVTKFINVVTKQIVNAYVTSDYWAEHFELRKEHLELIPLNREMITTYNKFSLAQEYAETLSQMLRFEREVGEKKFAPMLGREMIQPARAKPIALEKFPVPYVKNADPKLDWYLDPRTKKPLPKPKFDFSLVASKEELEKVTEELVTTREVAEEPEALDRWLRTRAVSDSPRYGIRKGDVWFIKRRDEKTYYALNRKRKALVILTDAARKRVLKAERVVAPSMQKKLDDLLARYEGGAVVKEEKAEKELKVKAVAVGVDNRGRLWVKVKGTPKGVTGARRVRVKRGMRRLVKGSNKLAAVLAVLDLNVGVRRVRELIRLARRFKVTAARKAKTGPLAQVILFPRPSLGPGVWEIFVPEYREELLARRFVPETNVTLIQLRNPNQAPKKWRKVARKLHQLVREEEEEA